MKHFNLKPTAVFYKQLHHFRMFATTSTTL